MRRGDSHPMETGQSPDLAEMERSPGRAACAFPMRAAEAINSVLPRASDLVDSIVPGVQAEIEALNFAWADTQSHSMMRTHARLDFNPAAAPRTPLYEAFFTECKAHPELTVRVGFHGTSEANVRAICTNGLDPALRRRQALGHGEYFAIAPRTAFYYALSASGWSSGSKPEMGSSLAELVASVANKAHLCGFDLRDLTVQRALDAAACLPMGGRVIIFALLSDDAEDLKVGRMPTAARLGGGDMEEVVLISRSARQLPLAVVSVGGGCSGSPFGWTPEGGAVDQAQLEGLTAIKAAFEQFRAEMEQVRRTYV